ncbi:high frequency lysogenization protein HflD [Marinobacterium jannaschii]|uniref:high frequency lysogenization protein HflD n=1 Tax=Marinobacterium jannaschii TaxID=64970 RepID=UPI00048863D1|nr:high frequency lysogenization protein HflD [Marinobacterium jannaschii]
MSRSHDEQAIALAGIFQAAALVEQIANRGMVPQNAIETSLYSIFVTSPKSTEEVYGGVHDLPYNLQLGLRTLQDAVDKNRTPQSRDITRYALSMMYLERKLSTDNDMLGKIGARLDQVGEQARYFNPQDAEEQITASSYCHPSVVANLASLYQETLSTYSFRIQVGGDPRHLQNAENAAKIRALLLAGIRSAMLWRQVGGKRWHLLFFKSRVRPSLKKIQR